MEFIGLMGVLIANVKRGVVSAGETLVLLEEMKRLKFRVSPKLEEDFLKRIGVG